MPSDTVRVERYGTYILGADLAAIGLGLSTQNGEVLIGSYVLSGPMVHLVYGNGGRALGSLALRLAIPTAFGMAGMSIGSANCSDDDILCGVGEAAVGVFLGAALATAIDVALLAKTTRRETPPAVFNYRGISANPNLGVRRSGGLTFGLNGSF